MNRLQRIEKLETERKNRVAFVPPDYAAQFLAKLQRIAERGATDIPKEQQSLAERLVFAQTKSERDEVISHTRQMLAAQGSDPRFERWQKLQRKAK